MAILQKCLFIKNYHSIININFRKSVFNFDVPCDARKFISPPILKMITDAGYFNISAWENVRFLTTVDAMLEENNSTPRKGKDSMETRAKPAVSCVYVQKKAILEPILLYHASKCKQTKKMGSEDCLWTVYVYCHTFFFSFFCQNANITGSNCAIIGCNLSKKHKLALSQT